MKRNISIQLLCVSIALNIFFIVSNTIKSTYILDQDDLGLVAEMTRMTVDSEDYAEIAARETIYAIEPAVGRFKLSRSSVYDYEVLVKTDVSSYIFSCTDAVCSDVENGGHFYSRYSEEKPLLPISE